MEYTIHVADIFTRETPTTNRGANACLGQSRQGLLVNYSIKTEPLQHPQDASQGPNF